MGENWKSDVFYLQGLIQQAYTDVNDSYESLETYDGDKKYQLAVSFLGMSYQGYLFAKQFYYGNKDIQRGEFDNYFGAYENFKFEMNKVISERGTNTSWLFSRLEQFNASMVEVNKLIDNIKPTGTR